MTARRLPAAAMVAALLAGALVSCHPPAPPPAPPSLPLPPAQLAPPGPAAVSGVWSFAITDTACVAHASSRAVSLELRIGGNDRVELSLAGPAVRSAVPRGGRRARLRFQGSAGAWTLPARSSLHRAVIAVVKLSEATAKHVLALLGGGRLRTQAGTAYIPVLRLPDSDVAGRDWFDCVRSELGRAPAS